jgi:hypothetical protein
MYQSFVYMIIKNVSRTCTFRQIHDVLSIKYGSEFAKLDIVDQFMSMRLVDIYVIFARCYQSLSRVWLNLGLHPDINSGMQYHYAVMKNVSGMPGEIIDLIASFIPEQNYSDIADPYRLRFGRSLVDFASNINFMLLLDDIRVAPSIRINRSDLVSILYNGRHDYDEISDLVDIDGSIVTRDSETDVPRYPVDYVFPPGNNVSETLNPINYLAPSRVSYLIYPRYNKSITFTLLCEPHV